MSSEFSTIIQVSPYFSLSFFSLPTSLIKFTHFINSKSNAIVRAFSLRYLSNAQLLLVKNSVGTFVRTLHNSWSCHRRLCLCFRFVSTVFVAFSSGFAVFQQFMHWPVFTFSPFPASTLSPHLSPCWALGVQRLILIVVSN